MSKFIFALAFLGLVATAAGQTYFKEEIGAWHFHTYFFEVNPSKSAEAVTLSFTTVSLQFATIELLCTKALREAIDNGTLAECSINQYGIGFRGPHPVSQWETCCNKTSFNEAHSFFTQNHGNLSVLLHPLTIYEQEDHRSRNSWLGKPVVLYDKCPCLSPLLPRPRPCPVYPRYSDDLPENLNDIQYQVPLPGTENYF